MCNNYGWDAGCSRDVAKAKREVEAASTAWNEKIKETKETGEKWLLKEKE